MKRSGIVLKLSRYFGTPAFCHSALLITLPILAQNLLTSSFSLIDTLMISSLGAIELTAMGLAASWIQLLNVALLGITSAAGVLVAQFWGGRKLGQVRRSYGGGLGFCLMAALLFLMVTALFPQLVMSLYSEDAAVMEAGAVSGAPKQNTSREAMGLAPFPAPRISRMTPPRPVFAPA